MEPGEAPGEAPEVTLRSELSAEGCSGTVHLMVEVAEGAVCTFYYSFDGAAYRRAGEPFRASVGSWTGAKLGLFCLQADGEARGYADVDDFRVR